MKSGFVPLLKLVYIHLVSCTCSTDPIGACGYAPCQMTGPTLNFYAINRKVVIKDDFIDARKKPFLYTTRTSLHWLLPTFVIFFVPPFPPEFLRSFVPSFVPPIFSSILLSQPFPSVIPSLLSTCKCGLVSMDDGRPPSTCFIHPSCTLTAHSIVLSCTLTTHLIVLSCTLTAHSVA